MSEVLKDRGAGMLGNVLRQDATELRRQVAFQGEVPHPNLPSESRVGKPKMHRTIETMRIIWNTMNFRATSSATEFDYKNDEHLNLLFTAARQTIF